mmetsp:Transcript_44973/g.50415  ORF Transcript_44973/g.50415 Transcript_44973/m.50415 type:complete len:94 (+) Transcript_44973:3-284(+)
MTRLLKLKTLLNSKRILFHLKLVKGKETPALDYNIKGLLLQAMYTWKWVDAYTFIGYQETAIINDTKNITDDKSNCCDGILNVRDTRERDREN